VLREIVVQSQDEFLIELVAAADRPALGVAGLAGLPLRSRWFRTGHSRLPLSVRDGCVPPYGTLVQIAERSVNVKDLALQADYICDHEIERQKRVNDLRGDVPSALGQIRVPTRRRESRAIPRNDSPCRNPRSGHPICSASSRSNGYATATLAPSKGRLIRCTVPGSTPNRLAMTRTPGRPGVARASRIRFSSAGAIGGRPRRLPSLLARASPEPPAGRLGAPAQRRHCV